VQQWYLSLSKTAGGEKVALLAGASHIGDLASQARWHRGGGAK